jgi:predicted nucleic acid-binding protein
MPVELSFVDTNILVYAMVPGDPRSSIADSILRTRPVINVQNLNEFANVTRRKLKWTWNRIEEALETIHEICGPPRPVTHSIHRSAIEIARIHNFSVYDALSVAAALEAGCTTVYSEDMHDGQKIRSLAIRTPFVAN